MNHWVMTDVAQLPKSEPWLTEAYEDLPGSFRGNFSLSSVQVAYVHRVAFQVWNAFCFRHLLSCLVEFPPCVGFTSFFWFFCVD